MSSRTGGELQRGGRKCRRRPQRIYSMNILEPSTDPCGMPYCSGMSVSLYLPREQLAVGHSNSQLISQERPRLRQPPSESLHANDMVDRVEGGGKVEQSECPDSLTKNKIKSYIIIIS